MEIIYRTLDGKDFKREDDAMTHEKQLFSGLKMWNRDGKEATKTCNAIAVYLGNDIACEAFLELVKKQNDSCPGIDHGDIGLFFWNSWSEEYQYIDCDTKAAILAMLSYDAEVRETKKNEATENDGSFSF